MRITSQVRELIKKSVCDLDPDADVYLFGSRVNDDARGGDIDILILSDCLGFRDIWTIRKSVLDVIGWQKLDIIIRKNEGSEDGENKQHDALTVLVKSEGVCL